MACQSRRCGLARLLCGVMREASDTPGQKHTVFFLLFLLFCFCFCFCFFVSVFSFLVTATSSLKYLSNHAPSFFLRRGSRLFYKLAHPHFLNMSPDIQYNPTIEYMGLNFYALAHMEKTPFASNWLYYGERKGCNKFSLDISKNGIVTLES